MNPAVLPTLLGIAVLLPLASFFIIFAAGKRMGKTAGYIATGAIVTSGLLAWSALLFCWIVHHAPTGHDNASSHSANDSQRAAPDDHDPGNRHYVSFRADSRLAWAEHASASHESGAGHDSTTVHSSSSHHFADKVAYTGEYYTLGQFGNLRLSINYYIDSLTVCMFCMVTLIASCIHFYAMGYMHDELHDYTDHEVTLSDGTHLHRPGRYPRFFQYMSLFCFSMLGLVLSGNVAMTFVFWELVGICSYFLIGFYIERQSASCAANKAFIVNRIGDFGMIIGLMIIWSSMGTLNFGDIEDQPEGIFSQVRTEPNHRALVVPDGLVRLSAREEVGRLVASQPSGATRAELEDAVAAEVPAWREAKGAEVPRGGYGYGLLVVAGLGIFCGCVGKSAQFPLHTWLPDAMEGPTPVSALVHSATMVAAGVFLVGRFYPVFTPEVLLVIAIVGCITLFVAATIAIVATDIKRVLAYSTISQLGYMMLALGVGGWLAGVLHLFTHAFFKSLLFLCSGSVIHGVHTNEMPLMGGLRKKMPYTAYTMLIGCLAIAGAGIPFVVGFSGYYSKDAILEHAFHFKELNSFWGPIFFYTAAGGAAITAFYMFRLWFMTFAGQPRDEDRYDHAHESPKVMYVPLIILALFAIGVAWDFSDWGFHVSLRTLLEQSRPVGTATEVVGALTQVTVADEHVTHAAENHARFVVPATLIAFSTALSGFLMAAVFYGWRWLNPDEVARQFRPIYLFLLNKWWFDELYDWIFVRPTLLVSSLVAGFDRVVIDRLIDTGAAGVAWIARFWEWLADQTLVDGSVDRFAHWTYQTGLRLHNVQTGRLRQYVMFIAAATVAAFVLASFLWRYSFAG